MIDKHKLDQIIESKLEQHEALFLVEVTVSPANDIDIVIDSDDYVSIDQCVELSKSVEAELDREQEDFSISVYSAGIGQPMIKDRQFTKCIGQQVEVVLRNGIKLSGVMTAFSGAELTIEYQTKEAVEGKKRKELVAHCDKYPMDQIKSVCQMLTIK